MTRRPHLFVAGLAATALVVGSLALVAPVQALEAVRYASPTGTVAEDCSSPAQACNLEKAINLGEYGDEVIIAPGAYTTSTQLNGSNAMTIRGADPNDRPVITTSANIGIFAGGGDGGDVRDIEVVHSGNNVGVLLTGPGTAERLVVRNDAAGGSACGTAYQGTFRDSLCVATGTGGAALAIFLGASDLTRNPRVRNVTAVATGTDGFGINVGVNGSGVVFNLDLRNVIAQGAVDIRREASSGATVNVTATSSRYAVVESAGPGTLTAPGTGSNIVAVPVFADGVDFRPTAGSPTVDAGSVDAFLGTTDLDGAARVRGPAPDMGAYELPDTTAPETTLTKKPKKKTFSRTAKLKFTSSEPGSTFRCQLDKKRVKPCTSPFKKKNLKVGKHRFKVWAVDAAGNQDPRPAKYSWTVRKRV